MSFGRRYSPISPLADRLSEAVPGVDRIVLTRDHVDHIGSAVELHEATGAPVYAGAGDADAIRTATAMPPAVFEDWKYRSINEFR